MTHLIPLMQREWLQHRFAWSLMLLLPPALALLPLTFGEVRIDDVELHSGLPIVLALGSLAAGIGVTFGVVLVSSLILMAGLARRDHGDRSHEFWLSLPTGHAESLAVPLLMHLLVLPAVALLVGLLSGIVVSLPVVTRGAGWAQWLALPWPALLGAALAFAGRLLAGLPLALLWLSPLILLLVLLGAWVGRWGVVILAVGVGIGSGILDRLLGQPWPALLLGRWFEGAALSLAGGSHRALEARGSSDAEVLELLAQVPGVAWDDFIAALSMAPSPALAGGLLLAAACFVLLVRWRRAGA